MRLGVLKVEIGLQISLSRRQSATKNGLSLFLRPLTSKKLWHLEYAWWLKIRWIEAA